MNADVLYILLTAHLQHDFYIRLWLHCPLSFVLALDLRLVSDA